VQQYAEATNGAKHDETHWNPAADRLIQKELKEFERNKGVKLTLPVDSGPERVRELLDLKGTRGGRNDVEQYFVPLNRQVPDGVLERFPPQHKKTTHRV